jgi:hypothetical protein
MVRRKLIAVNEHRLFVLGLVVIVIIAVQSP